MPRPGSIQRRLGAIGAELSALRRRVAELDAELAFLRGAAADAQTDAVVAGHVFAANESARVTQDLRRAQRMRDELAAQVAALVAEQDTLLERLLDDNVGAVE